MSRVFFTSDLHFGHRKVSELRGFGDTGEASIMAHDEQVRANWRAAIKDDDLVFVLGDLSSGSNRATNHAFDMLRDLPGRKRLIAGNHDPIHPMNRDAHKWAGSFAVHFEFVAPFARIRVQGREVMLSHFPYTRDRETPRYMQYRLRDEGLPLLHGHTHGTEKLVVVKRPGVDRVEVHVGLDAWGLRPVSEDEVVYLLDKAGTL